jgi:trehalose 6-phosphate phosphatase
MQEQLLPIAPCYAAHDVIARCAQAQRLLLALDYDGTLVPIAPHPHDAQPSARLLVLLTDLVQLPSATVAVISRRSLHDLCTLLPIPGLTYVSTHDAECRRSSGEMRFLLPPEAFLSTINRLQSDLLPLVGSIPSLTLERTQYALALHYRLATPAEGEQVVQQFQIIVDACKEQGLPLEVLYGKNVIEVRPVGLNKGRILRSLVAESVPPLLPVYVGDDVTDEDAFRAVNTQGISILVADPPPPTTAQYYLHNFDEVLAFLSQLGSQRRGLP